MLIAGLGNPGAEYERTRHNVGFRALDVLAEHFKVKFGAFRHKAYEGAFNFKGNKHLLLKPQTFMNLSGDSISLCIAEEGLTPEMTLVIVDDIQIPLGSIRLRSSGSSGGHNGLKSIIEKIGKNFWRLRIGVGMPQNIENGLIDHVLGSFGAEEEKVLEKIMCDIPQLVTMWLLGMGNKAMSEFNAKNYCE